jgi:hypothetical protein
MKNLIMVALFIMFAVEFYSSLSIQQKLYQESAENDNLRYQLNQCRILYKNN